MILWGPPGCGKTTIARLLAQGTDLAFEPLSAVFSGVADLRKIFDAAKKRREMGQGTLLFVDEIHRFNRAQQDAFLGPYVEDGTVILVGATTENPSFELIGALLSRAQVFVLHRLGDEELETLIGRAEANLGKKLPLSPEGRAALRAMADGDGRFLLNLVEEIERLPAGKPLGPAELAELVQRRAPLYDKQQEGHYNLISALHKSLRGSDTDAALYWLARMLAGGEDPIYVLRRLTRAAVEDIGLADPQAVVQALAAWDVYDRLGSPEGELAVAQLVIYLATAPKSNAVYAAFGQAQGMARETGSLMPPKAHPQRADAAGCAISATVRAMSTTTAPRKPFPGRTISRTASRAASSIVRPSAVSSATSRNASNTGTNCAGASPKRPNERYRHGRRGRRHVAPRPLVSPALPEPRARAARKIAAHRQDPGRRQEGQIGRPGVAGHGDPRAAA